MAKYYTTEKQSYKLLDLGIDPSTADMYYFYLWYVDHIEDSIREKLPSIKSIITRHMKVIFHVGVLVLCILFLYL